jgi:hypothetical protein
MDMKKDIKLLLSDGGLDKIFGKIRLKMPLYT